MLKKIVMSVMLIIISISSVFFVEVTAILKTKQKEKEQWKDMSKKHLKLMLLLNQWLIIKQEGKSIVEYFNKNKIESIAIYGMSYIGERLLDELKSSDINVKYAIDQNANNIYTELDVLSPDAELPEVDAIIVTPIYYFYKIQKMLLSKVDYKIISLEDLLSEV